MHPQRKTIGKRRRGLFIINVLSTVKLGLMLLSIISADRAVYVVG